MEPVVDSDEAIQTEIADAEVNAYVTRAAAGALESVPSLSAFQRRMERYPQLTADAQLALHRDVVAGHAAIDELAVTKRIGVRRKRELEALARRGERSKEMLIGSNFRLVFLICREKAEQRYGRERASAIMSDLTAEAFVALVEAINNYDPERCPVFSTYAARVVRDRVAASLQQDGATQLPASWARLKRIAAVRIPSLAAELGRHPTEDEVREALLERCLAWAGAKLTDEQQALPKKQRTEAMYAKLRKQGMLSALSALPRVLAAAQPMASLDAAVGGDSTATLGDFVSEPGDGSLLDDAEHSELRVAIAHVLEELPSREQEILRMRYGFHGSDHTYRAVGDTFGVTAERIRQIERNVLTKIHANGMVRDKLAAFLPGLDGEDLEAHPPDPSVNR